MRLHASHPKIVKRLKRASGHLDRVVAMIEDHKTCLEVAQQLQAVVNALQNAKSELVQDHIENCLTEALEKASSMKDRSARIKEFKEITKYL
jgi:DNA-binding FrmR family transcriptional regulator